MRSSWWRIVRRQGGSFFSISDFLCSKSMQEQMYAALSAMSFSAEVEMRVVELAACALCFCFVYWCLFSSKLAFRHTTRCALIHCCLCSSVSKTICTSSLLYFMIASRTRTTRVCVVCVVCVLCFVFCLRWVSAARAERIWVVYAWIAFRSQHYRREQYVRSSDGGSWSRSRLRVNQGCEDNPDWQLRTRVSCAMAAITVLVYWGKRTIHNCWADDTPVEASNVTASYHVEDISSLSTKKKKVVKVLEILTWDAHTNQRFSAGHTRYTVSQFLLSA